MSGAVDCPCCGYLTHIERAVFDICPVCYWEDDGQDDVDAHLVLGGPNRGSLWEARTNYLKLGACEERLKRDVRPPDQGTLRARQWPLLDDVATELIPCSNVSPWELLDGAIVTAIERGPDRVTLRVEAEHLRARLVRPHTSLRLALLGCSHLEYTPYDSKTPLAENDIVHAEPTLGGSDMRGGVVMVWGRSGRLDLRYRDLALRFDDGTSLALAAIDEHARAREEDWHREFMELAARKKDDA